MLSKSKCMCLHCVFWMSSLVYCWIFNIEFRHSFADVCHPLIWSPWILFWALCFLNQFLQDQRVKRVNRVNVATTKLHSNCILIRYGGVCTLCTKPSHPCVSPVFPHEVTSKSNHHGVTNVGRMKSHTEHIQLEVYGLAAMLRQKYEVIKSSLQNLNKAYRLLWMEAWLARSEHPWWKHNKTLDFGTWKDALHPCILFIFFSAAFRSEIFRASHFLPARLCLLLPGPKPLQTFSTRSRKRSLAAWFISLSETDPRHTQATLAKGVKSWFVCEFSLDHKEAQNGKTALFHGSFFPWIGHALICHGHAMDMPCALQWYAAPSPVAMNHSNSFKR